MYYIVNGCNVRVGDILVFGIISGLLLDFYGFMLEFFWFGSKLFMLLDGSMRIFIEDGD